MFYCTRLSLSFHFVFIFVNGLNVFESEKSVNLYSLFFSSMRRLQGLLAWNL